MVFFLFFSPIATQISGLTFYGIRVSEWGKYFTSHRSIKKWKPWDTARWIWSKAEESKGGSTVCFTRCTVEEPHRLTERFTSCRVGRILEVNARAQIVQSGNYRYSSVRVASCGLTLRIVSTIGELLLLIYKSDFYRWE